MHAQAGLLLEAKALRRRRSHVDGRTLADGIARLGDLAIVAGAGVCANYFRFGDNDVGDITVAATLIGVLLAANVLPLLKIYEFEVLPRLAYQWPRIFAGWAVTVAGVLCVVFGLKSANELSRLWVGSWFAFGAIGLLSWRLVLKLALERALAQGRLRRGLVLVGDGELIQDCVSRAGDAEKMVRIGGALVLDGGEIPLPPGARPIASVAELDSAVREVEADQVVIALPLTRTSEITALLKRLKHLPVEISLYPEMVGTGLPIAGVGQLGDAPILRLMERPLNGWRYVLKSLEDRILSAALLVLVSPLLLAIAAAIRFTSKGPIFYRQNRHGFDRDPILVYKFRTMYDDACDAPNAPVVRQATRDDPRVTPVGRFLRRTSLDELPQLINVIKGEMSLVGPRPHALAHDNYYGQLIDDYLARHRVKPGITGWAQVNGFRGETRSLEQMRRRIELDLYYIENWSLFYDARILVRTLFSGFGSTNAY